MKKKLEINKWHSVLKLRSSNYAGFSFPRI
jgi:hypothetical protein